MASAYPDASFLVSTRDSSAAVAPSGALKVKRMFAAPFSAKETLADLTPYGSRTTSARGLLCGSVIVPGHPNGEEGDDFRTYQQ